MAVTLGDAIVYFRGDDAHLSRTMQKSERETSSWASRMGGVIKYGIVGAAAVAAGAIVGVTATLPALISLGSDAEEMMGKFNVVFGDYAGDTIKSLDKMTRAMGRSKFEARGFAASFQDTFVPMGFARDTAADLSTQLTELVYDVSSFNNALEADVARDFQSALVGQHQVMLKYGVVINQAALDQELLNMGVEGGIKNATEQQKVMARLNLIMAGTSDAHGDAIRTSDSWANTMRRLKSTLTDVATEMGGKLLPVFTPILQRFADLAQVYGPMVADFFAEKLIPTLGNVISSFANFSDDAMKAFQDGGLEGLAIFLAEELKKGWDEHVYPVIKNWPVEFWQWITGEDGVLEQMTEKLDAIPAKIQEWIDATDFTHLGEAIGEFIVNGITGKMGEDDSGSGVILAFLKSVARALVSLDLAIAKTGRDIGIGLVSHIVRGIAGEEAAQMIASSLRGLFNADMLLALMFGGMPVGPLARLAGVNLPQFQSGGIVPGPMGQPQLAVVHGGELIIPAGESSLSSEHHVYFHGDVPSGVSPGEMQQLVRNILVNDLRSYGRSR